MDRDHADVYSNKMTVRWKKSAAAAGETRREGRRNRRAEIAF